MKVHLLDWPVAVHPGKPRPGEVQVWRMNLDPMGASLEQWKRHLGIRELARAERIQTQTARVRFITSHAQMRIILAAYLDQDPADLRITDKPGEKPRLMNEQNKPDLRFSLSHCEGMGLLAVAGGVEVGVDLEAIRENLDVPALAKRVLSSERSLRLGRAPEPLRTILFLRQWTRLEAGLKAAGLGLAAMELAARPRPLVQVRHLQLRPEWIAAVAVLIGQPDVSTAPD